MKKNTFNPGVANEHSSSDTSVRGQVHNRISMIFVALLSEYTSATTSNCSKHHASITIWGHLLHFSEAFHEHSCHKTAVFPLGKRMRKPDFRQTNS